MVAPERASLDTLVRCGPPAIECPADRLGTAISNGIGATIVGEVLRMTAAGLEHDRDADRIAPHAANQCARAGQLLKEAAPLLRS
jgi:hypothetical protein